jgi:hypothetical protein
MPKFDVILPIAGHISMTVEADNKEAAIDKAMDTAKIEDVESWEYYEHSEGNVNSFPSPYYPEADESS